MKKFSISLARVCAALALAALSAGNANAQATNPDAAKIIAQFDGEVKDKITPAFDKEVAGLRAKYAAALQQELDRATKAGKLDAAVPLQKEIELVKSGGEVAAGDTTIVPALVKLRTTFRDALKKTTADRDARIAPIFTRYDRMLGDLEANLTKSSKFQDALAVQKDRAALKLKVTGQSGPAQKEAKASPDRPGRIGRVRVVDELPAPTADGWITVYDDGKLYGCSPELDLIRADRIAVQDGALRLDNCDVIFNLQGKDVEVRTAIKKVSGKNLGISCRLTDAGYCCAWFNGGNYFGLSKFVNQKWIDFLAYKDGEDFNDFFPALLKVQGNSLSFDAGGKTILKRVEGALDEVKDAGKIRFWAVDGVALFRKIEIKVVK